MRLSFYFLTLSGEIQLGGKARVPCVHGARCSSVVRAFAHGAMGHRIDPSWWTH